MTRPCVQCDSKASIGLLCGGCAKSLTSAKKILPEHIASQQVTAPAAWLVDQWGRPHAMASARTTVGRTTESDISLFHESVSREHAVVSQRGDSWEVRDLGSRNATQINGTRVEGRSQVNNGAVVGFGEVWLYFRDALPADLPLSPPAVTTPAASGVGMFRTLLQSDNSDIEIVVMGSRKSLPEPASGRAMIRQGDQPWSELSLTPMERELLVALCRAGLSDRAQALGADGAVPTKQLVKALPFQSQYATEENVRQLVRRLRTTLREVGVDDLVGAAPRRGYFLTWAANDHEDD